MPAPYDNLESVVSASRMQLNDMIAAVGGDVLTDVQPFTIVAINNAWRNLQDFLSKLGFLRFKNEATFFGVGAAGSIDPASQPFIDWLGYFDGAITQAAPVLPADFIAPIELKERFGGPGGMFLEMDMLHHSLPLVPKAIWNRIWTWRNEKLWIPGTLNNFDLWMRYWSFAPDFVAASVSPFNAQLVPIMRCQNAFSAYLSVEIAAPRGDLDKASLRAEAEGAATILVGRENPGVLVQAAPPPAPAAAPPTGG